MKIKPQYSHFFFMKVWQTASICALLLCLVFVIAGQSPSNTPPIRIPSADDRKDPETQTIDDLVVKQQITRRKKEYDEMLKRGEDALKLSEDLETSFESRDSFSPADLQKLQDLEKVVSKIRDDLGGDKEGDNFEIAADEESSETGAKKDVLSAVKFLRTSTVKLVDELKKSTRFSISVTAIQTSNAVIRFARFLRLNK